MIWLDMNNLNVNASKSSCMVLSTRHNVRDINITINEDSINVDNDVKYLGVYDANNLSSDKHVWRKLGHGVQILPRLRGLVPPLMIWLPFIKQQFNLTLTTVLLSGDTPLNVKLRDFKIRFLDLLPEIRAGFLSKFNIPSVSQRRDYFNGINV